MPSFTEHLRDIVKRDMSGIEGSAHSFEHVERVTRIASYLAEREGADMETVQVASLLHDIGRTIGSPHSETGVEPARRILEDLSYPREKVNRILWIVRNHVVSTRDKLETKEGWVVWDADKLDLIGLTGVSRAYHYAGETGVPFEDVLKWCKDRSMINPYRFITETAKKLAEKRCEAMGWFSRKLEEELSLLDIR